MVAKDSSSTAPRIIPSLLQRQFTFQTPTQTHTISLLPISMMLLESARRYLAGPAAFGKTAGTLDEAMVPVFATAFGKPAYKAKGAAILQAYDEVPISKGKTVAKKSVKKYMAQLPAVLPLAKVLKEVEESGGLIPAGFYTAAGQETIPLKKINRRVMACLDGIECLEPEEQQIALNPLTVAAFEAGSGDEIYFMTSGTLWCQDVLESSFQISPITEHVGTKKGHKKTIKIPGDMKFPVHYDLQKSTIDPAGLPPYSLDYSITLYEREHSEEERRQAMAEAIRHAMDVLKSAVQLDPIGLVISVAQMSYDLAIALDDDDLLGHRNFRFGNIGIFPLGTKDTTCHFNGTHLMKDYSYKISSHYVLEDLPE